MQNGRQDPWVLNATHFLFSTAHCKLDAHRHQDMSSTKDTLRTLLKDKSNIREGDPSLEYDFDSTTIYR